MRHTQSKSNKSSDVSANVKVANNSPKYTGGSKRVSSDLREQSARKGRKPGVSEPGNRKATAWNKVNADTEKTLKKYNPSVVKKTALNLKRIKKPNEKYKQIGSKTQKAHKKVLKKVTKSVERNDEHEGPPTLCETFSRITTMVAETVINEKENQKLAESLLGKAKKETAGSDKPRRDTANTETGVGKSKGEPTDADSSASKIKRESQGISESSQVKSKKELSKVSTEKRAKLVPLKGKAKVEKSKVCVKKGYAVKSASVKTINEKQSGECLTKAVKDDEVSASGRGIATRRVSTPGSPECEKEAESKTGSEKNKVTSQASTNGPAKNLNVTKTPEKGKNDKKPSLPVKPTGKRKDNRTKSESKEKKPKINDSQLPIKKLVDEMDLDKDKDEDTPQGCSYKKVTKNPKVTKNNKHLLKTNSENVKSIKKENKSEGTAAKHVKPKLGSETDGSNSDELTLNILQRKTKKYEKSDSSSPRIKSEPSSPQDDSKVKVEEKVDSIDKNSNDKNSKAKKIKIEKDDDDMPLEKKILEEILKKRRSKETESDTDEDLEFRRLLAKKLAKNIEAGSLPQMKRKRVEAGPSDSDQRARRLRLFGFWSGPKRHRVASLNALAKVHCLYENESKGVMAEIEKMGQILKTDTKREKKSPKRSGKSIAKKDASEYEGEKLDSIVINKRRLRGTPGTRGAGKHWDMFPAEFTTSTSCPSSDESHSDTDMSKGRPLPLPPSYRQKMQKKEESDKEETAKAPKRRRKTEIGVTMDLKDMVVRKRMASLNASAILAASYSSEKRSNRKSSSGTSTEDGLSSPDEGRGDFLSADESDNCSGKKSGEKSLGNSDNDKSRESQGSEKDDNKRRKNFWKTKVENLKKASKEKRNSPSPILADFGVGRDLCTTVLEKEKKDELNDDRERDKGNGSCKLSYGKKYTDMKSKCKSDAGNNKTSKEKDSKKGNYKNGKEGSSQTRKNLTKRKLKDDDVKNINIEKVNNTEKSDEYEYKSDSDNGQRKLIELRNTGGSNKKVAVIVNQDTDVTITGVYVNSTRSTHHEGFCSIAGMQYRISSTSHTQTEATAVLKTSIASEQTPPPTEPTNCTSPRNHKSYTPLSALSNMQPPAGAPPHTHLPPPLPPPHHHHHHHHCGMGQHRPPHDKYLGHGPPHEQYLSHGPPQGPISPLGRRHGCSSAFSAPHCSSQPHPGRNSSPSREDDGYGPPLPSHGYFQPAGPLIHHHASNPPSSKAHSVASLDSASASESHVPGSGSEDIAESNRGGEIPPPPNAAHHMGYPRAYPPYQGGYYQSGYYPPPPQSSHYQTPPPTFHHYHHHHQDFCYPPAYPPSSYPPPTAYRRFLQPAPGYFTSEVTYSSSAPPTSQDPGTQQMVVPGSPSSSYTTPLDPYPPPPPYYAGYSGPGAACYTHPPSSRSLAFIEQTYQTCPCPMQTCPKNVHIGPLTGECKRPGALPLPPVALQLPQEPPGAAGPPSPARGSAGMPPLPSPVSNSARPNYGVSWDGRQTKSAMTDPSSYVKRDEVKAKLEVKKKCKTEILYAESNGIWNPTDLTKSNTTKSLTTLKKAEFNKLESSNEGAKNALPEVFSHVQGLLAISSAEFSKIPVWTEEEEEETICVVDEIAESKTEDEKNWTESLAKDGDQTTRKRKSVDEDCQKNRKRKKTEEEQEEEEDKKEEDVMSDELLKRGKRKVDTPDENLENKVRKMKKKLTVNQKDENEIENVTVSTQRNSHKGALQPKPKLLKDRNETVTYDTVSEVIEEVVKGQAYQNRKSEDVKGQTCQKKKSEDVAKGQTNQKKKSEDVAKGQKDQKKKSEEVAKAQANQKKSDDVVKVQSSQKKKSEEVTKAQTCQKRKSEEVLKEEASQKKKSEEVAKAQASQKKKSEEVSEKVPNRRKSSHEKWSLPSAEPQSPRKSRSCSPNSSSKRDKSRSPGRAARDEALKRMSEQGSSRGSRGNGKCKLELRSKPIEKISQEHSKNPKSSKKSSRIPGKGSQNGNSSVVKSKKSNVMSVNNLKKLLATKMVPTCPRPVISPKWSNGWSWDSESFEAKVYLTNDEPPVLRKCYSAMRHVEGDVIQPKDCVLLKSSPRKTDSPFIAKVAALWENPDDGEMMVSLLWYYRPEHTDQSKEVGESSDEIFASRHKDTNSVACIEDKCFVLTYNEYCRYRKKVKRLEEGVPERNLLVPPCETPYPRLRRQPPCIMAPDMVFFCRRVYDFRQKRLLKNPT